MHRFYSTKFVVLSAAFHVFNLDQASQVWYRSFDLIWED